MPVVFEKNYVVFTHYFDFCENFENTAALPYVSLGQYLRKVYFANYSKDVF